MFETQERRTCVQLLIFLFSADLCTSFLKFFIPAVEEFTVSPSLLCSGVRQVVDHFLGSWPRSCPYVQRADHAEWCPHTLCCSHPGEHIEAWFIFPQRLSGYHSVFVHQLQFYLIVHLVPSISALTSKPYMFVCVCNPQGHGMHGHGETVHIPFPFDEEDMKGGKILPCVCLMWQHS